MSQTDTFIAEVTEEVRRERLFTFFRRYGGIALIVIVVLLGLAIWYEVSRHNQTAEVRARGDALLSALEGPAEGRASALAQIDAGEGAVAAVTAFLQADAAADAGDVAGAVATLDAVARDSAAPRLYRDLATLKSAITGAGVTDANLRRAALEGLVAQNSTYLSLAREQLALIDLETGNVDAARSALQAMVDDAATSDVQRSRIAALLEALGAPVAQ
ncbi:hypothetical protein [Ketogulonicigenium vulgare]|uniref:Tetratricopeptide repeat-like domain-containing protein n=1 Tax=Ketogulonicigenium vulgare (strain WSH-001) TaxID=759362 RepID=F9Y565_KETVW|nr:hypothetical protein [Ketogulonicigenium vulgare]ADO42498.1 conserved hypothetical protein [Ketogulonicigenium vulgare Y25]AEM40697.1 hypothetical protein KVU_0858 [Ketogulonicigenium vulgare WSH-001]ALJ80866.1 hypothetical protein KVH_06555 [Ketogulonicigenium vulgare]AOZ54412.1 hypothetical protein KVC_1397 [Ketogulonicigenium vulgare]